MKFYIDESGNTGDLVSKRENFDITFNGQRIFSLAAIGLMDNHLVELEKEILVFKKKYKIQSLEIKAENIFNKKPKFIQDIVEFLLENKIQYFIELTDKKYFICNSIVFHQVYPPYFVPEHEERKGENQIFREICIDFFMRDLCDEQYLNFFSSCIEADKFSLDKSFDSIRKFSISRIANASDGYIKEVYSSIKENVNCTIEDFNDFIKKVGEEEAVKKFIPIPDETKRGNLVHLLPQIPSLTNIIARINYMKGGISDINFIHDRQTQFDIILNQNVQEMVGFDISEFNFTNADFNVSEKPNITFEIDSKENIGIQIADILAGFTMRYLEKELRNEPLDDIYHEIFKKIEFGKDRHSAINYVIGISNLVKLKKAYSRGIQISDTAQCMEKEYIRYLLNLNSQPCIE